MQYDTILKNRPVCMFTEVADLLKVKHLLWKTECLDKH